MNRTLFLLLLLVAGTLSAHRVYVGGGVTVHVGHPYRHWHERVYYGDPWYNPALVIPSGPDCYPGYVEGRPYYYWDPSYYYSY